MMCIVFHIIAFTALGFGALLVFIGAILSDARFIFTGIALIAATIVFMRDEAGDK